MFDRSAPYRHGIKLAIQSELQRLEYRFVLPSSNASVGRRGALALERAMRTGTAPIDTRFQQIGALDRSESVYCPLPSRAHVLVIAGDVDEVAPVEAPISLCARGLRFRNQRRNTHIVASLDFWCFEVSTVCQCLEPLLAHGIARGLSHSAQLRPVAADVRNLVGHNEMVLGIDGYLDVATL